MPGGRREAGAGRRRGGLGVLCFVLIDMTMPLMNGVDALPHIRKLVERVPGVLRSGTEPARLCTRANVRRFD